MDIERIWRQIERIKEWGNVKYYSERGVEQEILKPLNKIIDFERNKLIFENNFTY